MGSTRGDARPPCLPILLPTSCPSCGQRLKVKRSECPQCATAVEGSFEFPLLASLVPEDQDFVINFIKTSGNLKEMAKLYGVSYPTVRNRLDAVINRVQELHHTQPKENGHD